MVSPDEHVIGHGHTLGSLGGHPVRDAEGTLDALSTKISRYNLFLVYCRELAPGTVSLTGDWARDGVIIICNHDYL